MHIEDAYGFTPTLFTELKKGSVTKLKARQYDKYYECYSMYETPPGYEIIKDDAFFKAIGSINSTSFKDLIETIELFSESVRLSIK